MHTIYIENTIINHPRAQRIINHYGKNANIITCQHYGEVFNPKSQNFRIQKQKPALILAEKKNNRVLKAPEGFGIGGKQNYYFSHMLNCLYDCRYCFLQGMYPSANYVLFVNYNEFMNDIAEVASQHDKPAYFFSGYDCDSLAFEPVSRFLETFLPFFEKQPNAILELRTKSTNVKTLLEHKSFDNCVVAFSFTPDEISKQVEHKVPSLEKRIDAMRKLADKGWKIGLRFDPIIYAPNYQELYQRLVNAIFQTINPAKIHSVSIGTMRFPVKMHQKIVSLYPQDKLLAHPLKKTKNYFAYKEELEIEMKDFVHTYLQNYLPSTLLFECKTT